MTFNHVLLGHLVVLQDSRNRQNAQIAHVRKILLHTYFFSVCCKNSDYLENCLTIILRVAVVSHGISQLNAKSCSGRPTELDSGRLRSGIA